MEGEGGEGEEGRDGIGEMGGEGERIEGGMITNIQCELVTEETDMSDFVVCVGSSLVHHHSTYCSLPHLLLSTQDPPPVC